MSKLRNLQDRGRKKRDRIVETNKSIACGCQRSAVVHLENSKSKKGHNFVEKIGGLPPLLVWVPLLIANIIF